MAAAPNKHVTPALATTAAMAVAPSKQMTTAPATATNVDPCEKLAACATLYVRM